MTTFTDAERKKLAKSGAALSDGSYPIRNLKDLGHAIEAWGRGSGDKQTLKNHIMRRAVALGASQAVKDRIKALKP